MEQQQPHKRRQQPQPRTQTPPPSQQQQHQEHQPDSIPDAGNDDPSRVWLPEVVHHFAGYLSGNELACTLRLVNKATAAQFRKPQHTTVRLSVLVPRHAFAWRWGGPTATRSLTVRQRRQLPCLTARSGSVANLEMLLVRDDLTSPLEVKVLEAAAGAGQLDVCRWLRQQGVPLTHEMLDAAAGAGHVAVCEWLLAEGCLFSAYVMQRAAGGGHWAVCESLLAKGCPMKELAVTAAARAGHVGLMDWLLERTADAPIHRIYGLPEAVAAGCGLPTLQRLHRTCVGSWGEELLGGELGCVAAAAAGSPTADWQDKVEWLEGRGCLRSYGACTAAAQRVDGRDRLEWLQQRGYPISNEVAYVAAQYGNTDALEFLLAQGVQLDWVSAGVDSVVYLAAHFGHLAALKVLRAQGARIDLRSITTAAANGDLPVVAWLVKVLGAATALTAGVYATAATPGSADLLAWLHQRGCAWDASVFASAAREGSEEQLEWLVERGCPMGDDGEPYQQALENGDLALLRCLWRLGCPWGPVGVTFTFAIKACHCYTNTRFLRKQLLLALPWLVEQGCPVDWAAAVLEAEKRGGGEVLAWLRQAPSRWYRRRGLHAG
ncbi:Ankyrin repeat domain-containing protein [Tetrabaena socialis]|uniref:Ankyrin repeat domain-containing protein n=1 Tax=Tetrabaena socialis TaxID=47790 RepID=A0A2J8AED6_9CHLO|nr:Ankyrin repeat domain-containing protein [Tetrabaena socialis]|eukprot:PNH10874.1 Ankyrin repeat domain-containing protein [Tetrabaena socialis]